MLVQNRRRVIHATWDKPVWGTSVLNNLNRILWISKKARETFIRTSFILDLLFDPENDGGNSGRYKQ